MNHHSVILYEKKLLKGLYRVYDQKPENLDVTHLKQVHSTTLVCLKSFDEKVMHLEADGMIFNDLSIHPAIITADCMPVAFSGHNGQCFLHAGWRGLHDGIVLQQAIVDLDPYYVFVGPHIGRCCYQVGEEFKKYFPHSYELKKEGIYLSLFKELCFQLQKQFPKIQIESSNICTCCQEEFHSFRRNATKLRNWNVWLDD